MDLDPAFVEMLACPLCRTPVVPVRGQVPGLRCTRCGRIYPVEDGIPQMLPESARPGGPGDGA